MVIIHRHQEKKKIHKITTQQKEIFSFVWVVLFIYKENKMEIKILEEYKMGENTYFIIEDGEAIVIDPGADTEKVLSFAGDIKIKYIFLTHCHYDHIKSVKEIRKQTGALICCSEECKNNIQNPRVNLASMGLGYEIIIDNVYKVFNDNEEFDFKGNTIKVIKTPGHTDCSVCYLIENNLISGDTLFFQSVGRYDLPTGDLNILTTSIKNKLYCLDDNIKVYPGHGRSTTIGYEKKYNLCIKL